MSNENNVLLYDKSKANHEEASGSLVPSLSNDSPYFENIVTRNQEEVNTKFSIKRESATANLPKKELMPLLPIAVQEAELIMQGLGLQILARQILSILPFLMNREMQTEKSLTKMFGVTTEM